MINPYPLRIQQKVGIQCVPVSTVLGRKTVSNILEYLKEMFKGRVKGTLLFSFFFKDIKTEGRSIKIQADINQDKLSFYN